MQPVGFQKESNESVVLLIGNRKWHTSRECKIHIAGHSQLHRGGYSQRTSSSSDIRGQNFCFHFTTHAIEKDAELLFNLITMDMMRSRKLLTTGSDLVA